MVTAKTMVENIGAPTDQSKPEPALAHVGTFGVGGIVLERL